MTGKNNLFNAFLKKAKSVHGDRFGYSYVKYINQFTRVKIECFEHGIFEQSPVSHKQGRVGCKECQRIRKQNPYIKTEKYIFKLKGIHGDSLDFTKTKYKGANESVIVTCHKHGDFEVSKARRLYVRGCKKCSGEAKSKNQRFDNNKFKELSCKIHGDFFDYSKVNYITANDYVVIICPIHGEFKQKASSHYILGHVCPKCSGHGWSRSEWSDYCKRLNKSSIMYLVKMRNNEEEFFKIGITTKDRVAARFWSIKYKVKILAIMEGNPEMIYDLENNILKKLRKFKYIPLISFSGKHECISTEVDKDAILRDYFTA